MLSFSHLLFPQTLLIPSPKPSSALYSIWLNHAICLFACCLSLSFPQWNNWTWHYCGELIPYMCNTTVYLNALLIGDWQRRLHVHYMHSNTLYHHGCPLHLLPHPHRLQWTYCILVGKQHLNYAPLSTLCLHPECFILSSPSPTQLYAVLIVLLCYVQMLSPAPDPTYTPLSPRLKCDWTTLTPCNPFQQWSLLPCATSSISV